MIKSVLIKKIVSLFFAFSMLVLIILGTFAPIHSAFAALDCTAGDKGCDYIPLTTIPGATIGCEPSGKDGANNVTYDISKCQPVNPVKVIKNIYGVSIGIAAVLAVFMIIWAGIEYATTEAIDGKSGAKDKWHGALWGLVLLLSSYLILRTINVDLVNINLDLGKPIVGSVVDINAAKQELQKSLDEYTLTQAKLKGTSQTIEALGQQRVAKEKRLDILIGEGREDDPEAISLEGEIESIKQQVNVLQKEIPTLQESVEKKRQAVIQANTNATKLFCYTSSVPIPGGAPVSSKTCKETLQECNISRNNTSGTPTSTCQEAPLSETQEKYQYCLTYTETKVTNQYQATYIGSTQRTEKSEMVPNKICSITPAGCQTQRTSLLAKNNGKNITANGYISSLGSCIAELK